VFFSGTPAPLIYVSNNQINAVVPYEIRGLVSPYVQVSYLGQTSTTLQLAATSVGPALFTFNGSGSGPAAALNQNNSTTRPTRPPQRAAMSPSTSRARDRPLPLALLEKSQPCRQARL